MIGQYCVSAIFVPTKPNLPNMQSPLAHCMLFWSAFSAISLVSGLEFSVTMYGPRSVVIGHRVRLDIGVNVTDGTGSENYPYYYVVNKL